MASNLDDAGLENPNAEGIPTDTGNPNEELVSNSPIPESENERGPLNDEAAIRASILSQLNELRVRIDDMTEIPRLLLDVPLKCLQTNTIQYLSYHLDPESDIMTDSGIIKDYRGLAALIGLEDVFIRFVVRANYSMLKTAEVISKWLTQTEPLSPTLGNLQQCLVRMERHDVLEDMSVKMTKDAVKWKMTEMEVSDKNSPKTTEDTSWQLTRHDVVTGTITFYTCCLLYADQDRSIAQMIIQLYKSVCPDTLFFVPQFDLNPGRNANRATIDVIDERCGGRVIFILSEYFFASGFNQFAVEYCRNLDIVVSGRKTMYTAGLVYADEDELMAQLIIKLYKKAHKDALFFNPNFDLKTGKYVLDTTAKVISERCDHKVVFLLSEYFYASEICQFAVSYAAAHGTGNGNLIPFHLTRNIEAVPNVLKGIAGIRWFRRTTREHTWNILTDSLLGEKVSQDLLLGVKKEISKIVERDKEYYLQDPPYDDNVAPPGEPYPVVEPEGSSSMPSMEIESHRLQLAQELQERNRNGRWKFLKQIRRVIVEKVLRIPRPASSSRPSAVEMSNMGTTNRNISPIIPAVDGASGDSTTCCISKNTNKRKADETISVDSPQEFAEAKPGDIETDNITSSKPEDDKMLEDESSATNQSSEGSSNACSETDRLMSENVN